MRITKTEKDFPNHFGKHKSKCKTCNQHFNTNFKHQVFCSYDCRDLFLKLKKNKEFFKFSEYEIKIRNKLIVRGLIKNDIKL